MAHEEYRAGKLDGVLDALISLLSYVSIELERHHKSKHREAIAHIRKALEALS